MTVKRSFGVAFLFWALVALPMSLSHAVEQLSTSSIDETRRFVVGVENVDYFPHYNINREGPNKGVALAILDLFAQHMGYHFDYQAFPIRRLRTSLATHQTIDFSYPDHPDWSPGIKGRTSITYSDPVEHIVSGTVVPKALDGVRPEDIKTLAVIRGFTPTLWKGGLDGVQLLEVSDAPSALKMVLLGRADGGDVGLSVTNYHLQNMGAAGELVMAKSLAHLRFPFLISTVKHPKVVDQFNQFLRDHAEQIAAIKDEYKVLETLK